MSDKDKIDRRSFLGFAGMAGAAAGMALTPAAALAAAEERIAGAWPSAFGPNSNAPKWYPRDKPKKGEKINEFGMEVTIEKHEILPKVEIHAFTFNKTLPGPLIRVKEGDWVKVNLTNKTHDFHTIHWHGIYVPCEMDGVPLGTQYPVGFNQTFTYMWRAQPAGTHFYHCHNMTNMHIQAGLYGALVIESKDDPVLKTFPYEREYTFILSEVDTDFLREQMNEMIEMGTVMDRMNASPKLMAKMDGRMMGWFANQEAMLRAIKDGWVPPYAASRTGRSRRIEPNFFMINGKSYPMAEMMQIKRGENIRVRLINTGVMPHFMHLHGHDFWHVCYDGSPLANPVRMNTIPMNPGSTSDIIIQGTNPGNWHFHDHSDLSGMNNGRSPGGMMTMLMYDDAEEAGFTFKEIIALDS
jgi:FtsP/CotA-like multicopper oxidase with cupredoxin domain